MNKLFRRGIIALILAALLVGGIGFFLFEYFTQGQKWATQIRNPHLYTGGILDDLRITDRNDVLLFSSENGSVVWHEDEGIRRAVVHAIGDLRGNISSGVLLRYRERLINFGYFDGVYRYVNGGATLKLTIDANLCAAARQALDGYDGAIGVYNYQTGEVYAMVSTQAIDPAFPPTQAQEGAYINRFLSSVYTPGSIYKIVTLQAAIESLPDLDEKIFECHGKCEIGGEVVTCSGYHGRQDIAQAFANSCNCAFGELAVSVGAEKLKECADRAGLTSEGMFDGIPTGAGRIEVQDDAPANLAWAGIGQHTDTVNPAAFLRYVGAIANDGVAVSMTLTKPTGQTEAIMDAQTAQRLVDYMQNNVDQQYGAWRFGEYTVGAKSGTAQQDSGLAHSVFTGFVAGDEMPMAFFVIAEHAGVGQGVAMQAAAAVVQNLK